ncbi:uncharacterized protein V1510DRAFT_358627 [Dipodascopsis tothii]|uniref:uncharacterized protein n=1 Tax=Dipodascopsis tothii TaxID=44089 RepID=UPI0034CDD454
MPGAFGPASAEPVPAPTLPAASPNSKAPRRCARCKNPLSGTSVRALGATYHIDCFTCVDCGTPVPNRFFPLPAPPGSDYPGPLIPLCERDYFRRQALLCCVCDQALRGSYIVALGRKYHLEHFTCSICPVVFGADDNYYEHGGEVYCHFHYLTIFASRCEGCHGAILKQFFESFRNGRHQQWHPECYMILRFWSIRISQFQPPRALPERPADPADAPRAVDAATREDVRLQEQKLEKKVAKIWKVLSEFEEVTAACISDMLQYASSGAYLDAVLATSRLAYRIKVLFEAIDRLGQSFSLDSLPRSTGKEPKILCKRVVSFLSLISRAHEHGAKHIGITQDLLGLVTGTAHYLKLLIQYGLLGALKLDQAATDVPYVGRFLDYLATHNTPPVPKTGAQSHLLTDACVTCQKGIEDKCLKLNGARWHYSSACFECAVCTASLVGCEDTAYWSKDFRLLICSNCALEDASYVRGFKVVTKLSQYSFLLQVALRRLFYVLDQPTAADGQPENGGLQRAASTDRVESVEGYVNTLTDIRRMSSQRLSRTISSSGRKSRHSRIEPAAKTEAELAATQVASPSSSATSIPPLDGAVKPPNGRARDAKPKPKPAAKDKDARDAPAPADDRATPSPSRAAASPQQRTPEKTTAIFGEKYLTLDDIPRILAAEQAREQRPNAFRHQRHPSLTAGARPHHRLVSQTGSSHNVVRSTAGTSPSTDTSLSSAIEAGRTKLLATDSKLASAAGKYFSELSADEHAHVRAAAVHQLHTLLADFISLAELSELIEVRKQQSFWEKFGKAFNKSRDGPGDSSAAPAEFAPSERPRKKGVFRVPLEILVERSGADTDLGVSSGRVRIPTFLDDCISAMRRKDMSVEGVFRKNGNIRKLKSLAEQLDKSSDSVNLEDESPVQLAALLKKFLRELPDPLMTFRLYRLWILSQRVVDDDARKRVLHLTCALLPKAHRDSVEVILHFLNWVASFSHVDEESGSKMDIHNLATVITPNILYSNSSHPDDENAPTSAGTDYDGTNSESVGGLVGDNYFLGIEVLNTLVEHHEEFSVVPDGLLDAD